jgi:hypothetical protein
LAKIDVFSENKPKLRFERYATKELGLILLSAITMLAISPWINDPDQQNVFSGFVALYYAHNLYSGLAYSYPPLAAYFEFIPLFILHLIVPIDRWSVYSYAAQSLAERITYLSPVVYSPAFDFAYKIPMIASTLITGVLLLKIGKTVGLERKKLDFLLISYIFNPFVIFEASIHSPIDCFAAPIITGFVYAFSLRKHFTAGLLLSIGVFTISFPGYLIVLASAVYVTRIILWRRDFSRDSLINLSKFFTGMMLPAGILYEYLGNFIHLYINIYNPGGSLFVGFSNSGIWGIFNSYFGIFSLISKEYTVFFNVYFPKFLSVGLLTLFFVAGIFIALFERKKEKYYGYSFVDNSKFIILVLIAFIFFTPGSNPWWYLWFLPLLLLNGAKYKPLMAIYYAFSIWGLFFETILLGDPIFNSFSLSVFVHAISDTSIVITSLAFWNFFSSYHFFFWNFSSLTGGVILLVAIALILISRRTDGSSRSLYNQVAGNFR